jgi:hypothetical protein
LIYCFETKRLRNDFSSFARALELEGLSYLYHFHESGYASAFNLRVFNTPVVQQLPFG